jgi:DnaK suppressor protein
MGKLNIQEFKEKLLKEKQKILNGELMQSKDDLTLSQEDMADEADIASNIAQQQVSFNMRHRGMMKLRKIDEALGRIENNCFGLCEDCDEPIELKRLNNQPWATLCIAHAEEQEREQARFHRRA